MRFYLSAAWMRHAELAAYAEELRALGHEVTSAWHDIREDLTGDDGHRMSATPEARAVIMARDLQDIRDAHALVAFAEPAGSPYTRGTRHFELGAAFGWGKILFLVGPREEMLGHWHRHLIAMDTWADFRAQVRGL